jgi:prepilin-type N-terminal cleavage/methylation domain-containing protein
MAGGPYVDIEIAEDIAPRTKKSDKGFTLIELLIVIVILGVLSTVVVLSVGGITDKGKESACKADYNALATAVESFNAQSGSYPTTEGQLVTGKFLRTQSANYKIVGTAGNVNVDDTVANNPCTYDPDSNPV